MVKKYLNYLSYNKNTKIRNKNVTFVKLNVKEYYKKSIIAIILTSQLTVDRMT